MFNQKLWIMCVSISFVLASSNHLWSQVILPVGSKDKAIAAQLKKMKKVATEYYKKRFDTFHESRTIKEGFESRLDGLCDALDTTMSIDVRLATNMNDLQDIYSKHIKTAKLIEKIIEDQGSEKFPGLAEKVKIIRMEIELAKLQTSRVLLPHTILKTNQNVK